MKSVSVCVLIDAACVSCLLLLYSVWLVLQGCIDLTVPLHKFDRSRLQENYYTTLNVNPKVLYELLIIVHDW